VSDVQNENPQEISNQVGKEDALLVRIKDGKFSRAITIVGIVATFVVAIATLAIACLDRQALKQNKELIEASHGTAKRLEDALIMFCRSLTSMPEIRSVSYGSRTLKKNGAKYKIGNLRRGRGVIVDLANSGPVSSSVAIDLKIYTNLYASVKCDGKKGVTISPGEYKVVSLDIDACLGSQAIQQRGSAELEILLEVAAICPELH
jgi:hypothetical protein